MEKDGKYTTAPIGSLFTELPKSVIKVSDASGYGDFPFFTSGDAILKHSESLVDGENLYMATGGMANVKYYDGEAAYSTDTWVIKAKDSIDSRLLYYHILSLLPKIDYHYFQGSGLKHLQKKDFKRHEIIFPTDDAQQKKIADILATIDNSIAETEELINKYESVKKGLMQDLLSNGIDENGNIRSPKTHAYRKTPLGLIPEGWRCESITSFTIDGVVKAGPFGSSLKKEFFVRSGYKIYGQEQILNQDPNFGDYYIDELRYKALSSFSISPNDIIMTCVGSGTYGKVLIVTSEFKAGIINPRVMRFSVDTTSHNIDFVKLVIESEKSRIQMKNLLNGSTMPVVNKSIMMSVNFPIPTKSEQERIVQIINTQERTLQTERDNLNKLLLIRKGLLKTLVDTNN